MTRIKGECLYHVKLQHGLSAQCTLLRAPKSAKKAFSMSLINVLTFDMESKEMEENRNELENRQHKGLFIQFFFSQSPSSEVIFRKR